MSETKLIITADDFGLTEGINEGIVAAYQNGILTRTSVIANSGAFDHAVKIAGQHGDLKVGVHLTLVEETPLSSLKKIKSLVEINGNTFLRNNRAFFMRYMLRQINLKEVYTELEAQIIKVMNSGISINHLDSHQHLHMLPGIFRTTLDLAQKYNINKIRIPKYDIAFVRSAKELALTCLSKINNTERLRSGFSFADNFWGLIQSGNVEKDDILKFLDHIKPGTTEMMFHPGYADTEYYQKYGHWCYKPESEFRALTSETVIEKIKSNNIDLVS